MPFFVNKFSKSLIKSAAVIGLLASMTETSFAKLLNLSSVTDNSNDYEYLQYNESWVSEYNSINADNEFMGDFYSLQFLYPSNKYARINNKLHQKNGSFGSENALGKEYLESQFYSGNSGRGESITSEQPVVLTQNINADIDGLDIQSGIKNSGNSGRGESITSEQPVVLTQNINADIDGLDIQSGIKNIIKSTYKDEAITQYIRSFERNIEKFSSIGKIKAYAMLYNNVFLNTNSLCSNNSQNIHVLDSFLGCTLSKFIALLSKELDLKGIRYIDDYLADKMQNSNGALKLAVCRLQQIFNKTDDPIPGRIDNLKQLSNIAAMFATIDDTTKIILDMSMEDNITTQGGCIPGYINRMIQVICNYINNNDLGSLKELAKDQRLPKTYPNTASDQVITPIEMVIGRLELAENRNDNILAVFNGATDEGDLESVCRDLGLGDISNLTVQETLELIEGKLARRIDAGQSAYRSKGDSCMKQMPQSYINALTGVRRALGQDANPYNDTELKDMCETCFYNLKELGFKDLASAEDLLGDAGGAIISLINSLHSPYKKRALNSLSKAYDAFLNATTVHPLGQDPTRMTKLYSNKVMSVCKELRVNAADCKECLASLMELGMSIEDGISMSKDPYINFPGVEFLRNINRVNESKRQQVINRVKQIYEMYKEISK